MENKNWRKFEPASDIEMPISCTSLISNVEGLMIIYEDLLSGSGTAQLKIIVKFDSEAVLSLRKSRTTDFYNNIAQIEDIDNSWIFVTDDSQFLKWLTSNSPYKIECLHYKFITEIEIIDVLSFRPPSISKEK